MSQKTHEFLELFLNYENDDVRQWFGDVFCEFINELNEADLSERTLNNLNGIFEKDMRIFFEKVSK